MRYRGRVTGTSQNSGELLINKELKITDLNSITLAIKQILKLIKTQNSKLLTTDIDYG